MFRPQAASWARTCVYARNGCGAFCAAALCLSTPAAAAQGLGTPSSADVKVAQVDAISRTEADQLRLRALADRSPSAYEDRYLDPSASDALSAERDAASAAQPEGLRAWLLESRIGLGEADSTGFGKRRATELGTRVELRRETLDYGEFVLQADTRHLAGDSAATLYGIGTLGYARRATSGRYTLRNFALPIDALTYADSALGDLNSEVTDGLSRNYRLSLGTTAVRGASVRIYAPRLDVRAGVGERGYLAGGPYAGFEASAGTLAWLGATRRFDNGWYAAAQVGRASRVPADIYSLYQTDGNRKVDSWATSLGYGPELLRDGDFRVRTTLLGSRSTADVPGEASTSANGLFVEGSFRSGRYRHEAGVYASDPQLYFGDRAPGYGASGAYWRVDHNATRWNWGLSIDGERASTDPASFALGYRRTGVSGNVQYLIDRRSSIGATASVSQTRYDADNTLIAGSTLRSLYANAFVQTRWFDLPRTRLSLTVRQNQQIVLNGGTATGQEVQWEQDWLDSGLERRRTELSTTLGYASDQSDGSRRHYPTAGVQFRYDTGARTAVVGNLRYTSQSGGLYTSRGLSGMLSAEYEWAPGVRLGISANLNQARTAAVSVAAGSPLLYRSNDKTIAAYIRWEGSAGSGYQPVGLRGEGSGGGSGRIDGQVFFDASRDGVRQSGEGGAANVEVLLDGRYRTLTDAQGRFEFPVVTTGRHQLSLTPESIPLPWGPSPDTDLRVDVPLRGQAVVAIPVSATGAIP